MIIKETSFQAFKSIYDSGNFYFTEYEDGKESPDYELFLQVNAMLAIRCRLENGTDQFNDYLENWQSKSGEKNYLRKGWQYEFTDDADGNYFDFNLNDVDDSAVESFLFKGTLVFNGDFSRGDKYEITIEHPNDGTIGYLCKDGFVEKLEAPIYIMPPAYDYTSSKKKIPAGISIRVKSLTAPHNNKKILVHAEYEY